MYEDADRLIKKAAPFFAPLIACIGGSCFAIFAPVETIGHARAIQYSVVGILGTLAVAAHVRKLWLSDEDFFGFRSRLLAFLLCLCWSIGAISGFILFYFIPRHAA